jgi:hypothetical protein
MTRRVFIFLLAVLITPVAVSSVAKATLEGLAESADAIVIVKVDRIEERDALKWANATVTKVLKGTAGERLTFLAQPTWTCDISEANEGEEALLFLERASSADWMMVEKPKKLPRNSFLIAWSGRGRMPVRQFRGTKFATFWDVTVPGALLATGAAKAEFGEGRAAPLDRVVRFLRGRT